MAEPHAYQSLLEILPPLWLFDYLSLLAEINKVSIPLNGDFINANLCVVSVITSLLIGHQGFVIISEA